MNEPSILMAFVMFWMVGCEWYQSAPAAPQKLHQIALCESWHWHFPHFARWFSQKKRHLQGFSKLIEPGLLGKNEDFPNLMLPVDWISTSWTILWSNDFQRSKEPIWDTQIISSQLWMEYDWKMIGRWTAKQVKWLGDMLTASSPGCRTDSCRVKLPHGHPPYPAILLQGGCLKIRCAHVFFMSSSRP